MVCALAQLYFTSNKRQRQGLPSGKSSQYTGQGPNGGFTGIAGKFLLEGIMELRRCTEKVAQGLEEIEKLNVAVQTVKRL